MPSNIIITTAQLFNNEDALVKITELLDNYSDIVSFTYVDSNKYYMFNNTPCQLALPNELHILLSNMSNYTTTNNDEKATYVLAEISSWKPMIVTINGTKKHVVSHTEYVKTLEYFTTTKVSSST